MSARRDFQQAINDAISAHELLIDSMDTELQRMEVAVQNDDDEAAQEKIAHDVLATMLRRADDHLSDAILWMEQIQREMDGLWSAGAQVPPPGQPRSTT